MKVCDPRNDIISQIEYTKYIQGKDRSTVSVDDNRGDAVYIPLCLPDEVYTDSPVEMPFIMFKLMNSPSETMNIGGDRHWTDAYLDVNIYYTLTDTIDYEFGERVADELIDKIVENRSSVTDTLHCEIVNDGRENIEKRNNRIVYNRILELHCSSLK